MKYSRYQCLLCLVLKVYQCYLDLKIFTLLAFYKCYYRYNFHNVYYEVKMKEITEEQAQELADLLGLHIAVNDDCIASLFEHKPFVQFESDGFWSTNIQADWASLYRRLEIKIVSNKPWFEQLWCPR